MSLATTLLLGGGIAFLQSLLGKQIVRNINWVPPDPNTDKLGQPNVLIPQVVVSENHLDRLGITEHPVEQGAAITDHAFKMPAEVAVKCGWSLSGGSIAPGSSILSIPRNITLIPSFSSDPNLLRTIYDRLLRLQESRQLVNLNTGKRLYQNMLMHTIAVETNKRSENSLDISMVFRQIVIAKTQVVEVPSKEVQEDPEKTAPMENNGTKQLTPGDNFNPAGLE